MLNYAIEESDQINLDHLVHAIKKDFLQPLNEKYEPSSVNNLREYSLELKSSLSSLQIANHSTIWLLGLHNFSDKLTKSITFPDKETPDEIKYATKESIDVTPDNTEVAAFKAIAGNNLAMNSDRSSSQRRIDHRDATVEPKSAVSVSEISGPNESYDEICSNFLTLLNGFLNDCSLKIVLRFENPIMNSFIENIVEIFFVRSDFNEFCFVLLTRFFVRFYSISPSLQYEKLMPCLSYFIKIIYEHNRSEVMKELDFIESRLNDFSIDGGSKIETFLDYYYFSALNFLRIKEFNKSNKYFSILLKLPLSTLNPVRRARVSINFIISYYFSLQSLTGLYLNSSFEIEFRNLLQFQQSQSQSTSMAKYRIIDILVRLHDLNFKSAEILIREELSLVTKNDEIYERSTLPELFINFRILNLKQKTKKFNRIYFRDLIRMDYGLSADVHNLKEFLSNSMSIPYISSKWRFDLVTSPQANEEYLLIKDSNVITSNTTEQLIEKQLSILKQVGELNKLHASFTKLNTPSSNSLYKLFSD